MQKCKLKNKKYVSANNWVIRSFVNEVINRNARSVLMISYNCSTLVEAHVWHRVFSILCREIYDTLSDYVPRDPELKKEHFNLIRLIKFYL